MHSVLVIGLDPHRVPGPWDPEPVAAGIRRGLAGFTDHGIDVHSCLFGLDGSDDVEAVVASALTARRFDVVVIGGGLRKPEELLELFEAVLNLVHRLAPDAAIGFSSRPDDLVDAALRRLG